MRISARQVSGREGTDLVARRHTERCMLLLQKRVVVNGQWKLAAHHVEAENVQSSRYEQSVVQSKSYTAM